MDLERMQEHRWRIREQGQHLIPFRQDQLKQLLLQLLDPVEATELTLMSPLLGLDLQQIDGRQGVLICK